LSDHSDGFTALIDTDVLVGSMARVILLTLAEAGFFRLALFTISLKDEFPCAFLRAVGIDKAKAAESVRATIAAAFEEALVDTDPGLVDRLEMKDPNNRHILAAAIQARADVILTWNLKDFEADVLKTFQLEAKTPDDFIADTIGLKMSDPRPTKHGKQRPRRASTYRPQCRRLMVPGSVRLRRWTLSCRVSLGVSSVVHVRFPLFAHNLLEDLSVLHDHEQILFRIVQ
jgi:hypothetical protein